MSPVALSARSVDEVGGVVGRALHPDPRTAASADTSVAS